ncbi:hypothetical protein GX51_01304 [Blastomyces parvus]|uniref:Uncharacterized protein n=1 Tax=Blastomyces parvus TaxID=2060905 RepID=A0A2B7XH97_9EURO|nr:hypothetical protein GX51_01304 [Blastomyces parvus]
MVRSADKPITAPKSLLEYTLWSSPQQVAGTSTYHTLEATSMRRGTSQEYVLDIKSVTSVRVHGPNVPFQHQFVIKHSMEDLLKRHGHQGLTEYTITTDNVKNSGGSVQWKLALQNNHLGKKDWFLIGAASPLCLCEGVGCWSLSVDSRIDVVEALVVRSFHQWRGLMR